IAFYRNRRRFLESTLIVGELERIGRPNLDLRLLGRPFVEQQRRVLAGSDAAVMAAIRADVEVADELLAQIRVSALVALLPGVGRNLVFFVARKARLFLFAEPSH